MTRKTMKRIYGVSTCVAKLSVEIGLTITNLRLTMTRKKIVVIAMKMHNTSFFDIAKISFVIACQDCIKIIRETSSIIEVKGVESGGKGSRGKRMLENRQESSENHVKTVDSAVLSCSNDRNTSFSAPIRQRG